MKKIFVIAVLLVVIGVICAVFLTRPNDTQTDPEEKPWTVGESVSETATQTSTTQEAEKDAVMSFSDYIHDTLREDYVFLSEETAYTEDTLRNALLGMYIYDVDGDADEELTLVRSFEDGVYLDIYEYADGKVQYADSVKLVLDTMNKVDFSMKLSDFSKIAARLTIYPHSKARFYCLTVEQETTDGDYNAYTTVFSYKDNKLEVKKSYRLRQREGVVTLMCTDNVTLLYRNAAGQNDEATDEGVSVAKYTDLNTAFQTEFEKIGLSAPKVQVSDGALSEYKVTPVENAQLVFEFVGDNASASFSENGFLQSFILNV